MSQLFGFPSGLSGGSKETSYLTSRNTDRITDANTTVNTQTSASRNTSVQTSGESLVNSYDGAAYTGNRPDDSSIPEMYISWPSVPAPASRGFYGISTDHTQNYTTFARGSVTDSWYSAGNPITIPSIWNGIIFSQPISGDNTPMADELTYVGGSYKAVRRGECLGLYFRGNMGLWTNRYGHSLTNNYKWTWHSPNHPIDTYYYTMSNPRTSLEWTDWYNGTNTPAQTISSFNHQMNNKLNQGDNIYGRVFGDLLRAKRETVPYGTFLFSQIYLVFAFDLIQTDATYSVSQNTSFTTNWGTNKVTQRNTNFSTDFTTEHITYG